MSNEILMYILGIAIVAFIAILVAFVFINKALNKGERKYLRELRKGTESNKFSSEILYQKLYIIYAKIPGVKRYLLKLRRKLEINNCAIDHPNYFTCKIKSSTFRNTYNI